MMYENVTTTAILVFLCVLRILFKYLRLICTCLALKRDKFFYDTNSVPEDINNVST